MGPDWDLVFGLRLVKNKESVGCAITEDDVLSKDAKERRTNANTTRYMVKTVFR